jgi:hypothetical protein
MGKLSRDEKKKLEKVQAVPLQNEYQVAEKWYEDELPEGALGYLRIVANDVYNSAKRVQITSSMFGPSNHNGSPIMITNFEKALAVYGVRKAVRANWLNDKDEFYYPKKPSSEHELLIKRAALYTLIDGAYASSLKNIKYDGKKFEFRNSFFPFTPLELRNWGASDVDFTESEGSKWIRKNKKNFSDTEKKALKALRDLVKETFMDNNRTKGDTKRQVRRSDAGIRQLINGLLDFKGANLSENLLKKYKAYLVAKEELRSELEVSIYGLSILLPFEENTSYVVPLIKKDKLKEAVNKLHKTKPKKRVKAKKSV